MRIALIATAFLGWGCVQSNVVVCGDGTVVLAGQSHDNASAWSADALAPPPLAPRWMERLLAFDPRRVVFAHDAAVWEP